MQRMSWWMLLLCVAAVHAWANNHHHDVQSPSASITPLASFMSTWSTTTTPSPIQRTTIVSQTTIQQHENALRNCIRQAACNALIYQGRWKFCVAIEDNKSLLLECLTHDVACAGNFWTPRTHLVHFGGNRHLEALLQHHWQKTTILSLNSTTNDAPHQCTKALRSIPTRILPRLSNSGHSATDIPVFDLIVTSSHRLEQSLMMNDEQQQRDVIGKKKKKRRKKKKDLPWVVQTSPSSSSSIGLSLPVLQAAKQVVVVEDSIKQEHHHHPTHENVLDLSILLPRAIWIPSPTTTITPQRPEDVPWGTTWT